MEGGGKDGGGWRGEVKMEGSGGGGKDGGGWRGEVKMEGSGGGR